MTKKINYPLKTRFGFIERNAFEKNQGNQRNKTNDLILNLTPENVTQHSRIVTTTRKGSSTPTKMSKIIGDEPHQEIVCTSETWLHSGHRAEKSGLI